MKYIVLLVLVVLAVSPVYADAIVDKDGNVHKGKIYSEDREKVILQDPEEGFKVFKRSDIAQIIRDNPVKEDKNEEIRAKFVELLNKLKEEKISAQEFADQLVKLGKPIVSVLLDYLKNKPEEHCLEAIVDVLVRLKDKDTISHLKEFSKSKSKPLSKAAVAGIRQIGDPAALEALVELMSDKDKDVSGSASKSFTQLLAEKPDDTWLFNRLRNMLSSAKPPAKKHIINCLIPTKSKQAVRLLLEVIKDSWEKTDIRVTAVTAVGRFGFSEPDICDEIRNLLEDKEPELRKTAAQALGNLDDAESIEELIELLKDQDKDVREYTHSALKLITGLKFPLNHPRWAVWNKMEWKDIKARRTALLENLSSNNKDKVVDAIHELAKISIGKKQIVSAFLELLDCGISEVRQEACTALGSMKAKEAVSKLVEKLDDYDGKVRAAAHNALQKITGKNLPLQKDEWEKSTRR